MPKCTTSTSPESSVISMYLPRRSTLAIFLPARREVNSFRVLCRRIARIAFLDCLTSAVLILLADDVPLQVAAHHLDLG